MLILNDSWFQLPLERHPCRWLATAPGELCSHQDASQLADTFPTEGSVRRDEGQRTSGKRYRNFSRPLSWPDDESLLGAQWRRLVADLVSHEYRGRVARLLEQEPADRLELRLVHHGSGDWLGPHTDREDKLFSHIIYFNPGWLPAWGGCLEILRGEDAGSAVASICPELGASVLLARASNSWHHVTRVSAAAPARRRSLLIHGLRR